MIWTLKGSAEEKFEKVAQAGIQSTELVSEHESWSDTDVRHILSLCRSYGIGIDVLLASRDWVHRPVSMVNPDHRQGFLRDVSHSIEWAKRLSVPQIILMSGNEQPGLSHEAQYRSLVEAGKQAADLAADANVMLILENLNSRVDHKGYFLTSAKESLRAVKEIDHPHLTMLFDIYHEYTQNGDPLPLVSEAAPYVSVYHVADSPGRHQPGTGEMKWDDIFRAIGKTNFAGYLTLEYVPTQDDVTTLINAVTQMRRALIPAAATTNPT